MLPLPLNTKLSQLFLLTGCLKATYTCKEEQISSPGYLASDRQHAKSRRTEIDKIGIFLWFVHNILSPDKTFVQTGFL